MNNKISSNGRQLIFLISQPRAGSTLLQRIIAGHSAIHTAQEPTIMLHPLYALRESGYEAEYNAAGAHLFTSQFLDTLPGGQDNYDEALRRMAAYLYGQALVGQQADFFLDKTPRYYFIIPDLARLFPAARFVILLRHPLGVLNSIWTTWMKDHWFMLHGAKPDLLTAPKRLVAGIEALGSRACVVRYEKLVSQPEAQLRPLFEWLELEFDPALVDYGRQANTLPQWQLADQKRVYQERRPVTASLDGWQKQLRWPQFWQLAHDYRHALDDITWGKLGYDLAQIDDLLAANRPPLWQRKAAVSMNWLLASPPDDRTLSERARLKLARLANGAPNDSANGSQSASQ